MALSGIDVSEYQGDIDWQAVADSGVTFCILKGTEGVESFDPYFARNWQAARSVGIIRSAYHFFIASKDPIVQANSFLRLTQKVWLDNDLPPVLDLEKTYFLNPDTVIARAKIWLNTVEKAIGRRPIVYTFPNFWENTLGNPSALADYPLWIAHYETDQPIVPGGWRSWTIHQYSESGTVPGIEGNVDMNHFNGNLDNLQKLLKSRPPLKIGSRGQVVAELQKQLTAKGFKIGTADGAFGKNTKAAVISFQKQRQLAADGIVGLNTWTALQGSAVVNPGPATNGPASTTIQLTDVCLSYRQQPHQDQALQWLQSQIAPPALDGFAQGWRNAPESTGMGTLTLANVCLSYKKLPHQDQALGSLQTKISPGILAEFAQRWRQSRAAL
jgi:lysozyme